MFGSRTSAPKRALPSSFAGVSRRGIERPTRRGTDGWSAGISGGRLKRAASCASRSEEHTSELQSLMRISYAVFCLKKKNKKKQNTTPQQNEYKMKTNQI